MAREEALSYIVAQLSSGRRDMHRIKQEAAKLFSLDSFIKNPDILAAIPQGDLSPELRAFLLKKPTRTLSGVTPIAVMIAPDGSCRHSCIYCPSTGLAAKSYTGYEPAAMRSIQHGFDPYYQTHDRVSQLESAGHEAGKCELILMGGTFLETPAAGRRAFVKGMYEGLNGRRSATLEEAMARNETALHRAIGLTIETRPDACLPYIDEMLSYGATRVELGVQHPDDGIYKAIRRGHHVKDVIDSTKALKDSCFKVLYHIMPGLPGSSREKDISMFRALFEDPSFRPDMLKIYPTLVIEGTELHRMERGGSFSPLSAEDAADIISEAFRCIPPYVRVMRIQRDIPAGRIGAGVKRSNLRELVDSAIKAKGIEPREIRSREAGLWGKKGDASSFSLKTMAYEASGGQERFISFEDEDGLIAGFLRLRLPSQSPRQEIDGSCALVRELHVYGSEAPIHGSGPIQHRGLGSRLLEEAERIAKDQGRDQILVISGVGARGYYRKHGYGRVGPYMGKSL